MEKICICFNANHDLKARGCCYCDFPPWARCPGQDLSVPQGSGGFAPWVQRPLSTLRMHFDVMIHTTSVVFSTSLRGLDSVPSNEELKVVRLSSLYLPPNNLFPVFQLPS